MKKTIVIISDTEEPITNLLDRENHEILKTEREDTYVLIKKDK